MNPYERRIIHSALQGRNDVYTYSDGEEFIIKEFNEEDAFIYSEEDEGYPPEECLI